MCSLNADSGAGRKFDGIHLDVEPHTLPAYRSGTWEARRSIIRQFLDMNASVIEVIAGRSLSYGVDVVDFWHPYWILVGGNEQLDRPELWMEYDGRWDYPTMHLMDMVKEVAIMSYHRDPVMMVRKTRWAIDYAANPEVGALVSVGVQTAPACVNEPGDPPDPPGCRPPSETWAEERNPRWKRLCASSTARL